MHFKYTALTSANKKANGVLDADSLEAAKEQLHKMELSIIDVVEVSETEYNAIKQEESADKKASGILSFYFKAKDAQGKDAEGTIDAADDFNAFRRLKKEYHFRVELLAPADATESQKKGSVDKVKEFESRLDAEMAEEKGGEEQHEEREIDEHIAAEIDRVIVNTKKVLEGHNDIFSPELSREISNTLGQLERIRSSNNLKHIAEVSNQLYEMIMHPDALPEDTEASDEGYQNLVADIGGSAILDRGFQLDPTTANLLTKINARLVQLGKKVVGNKKVVVPTTKKNGLGKLIGKFIKSKPKPAVGAIAPGQKHNPGIIGSVLYLKDFLTAPNPILRKIRKQDFMKSLKLIFKRKPKQPKGMPVATGQPAEVAAMAMDADHDLVHEVRMHARRAQQSSRSVAFFYELDSFIGWLLFFYIVYFYLANVSIEKSVGLEPEFVIRTLQSPLLFNVSLLLLIVHFSIKLKMRYLPHHLIASLFLFFLTIGTYIFLIFNF